MTTSNIKEFQAGQAMSIIVKMMNARELDMVPKLCALKNPHFGDMVKIAVEMLRAAGHEEDAKSIEAMPLRPLRLVFSRATPEQMKAAGMVKMEPV